MSHFGFLGCCLLVCPKMIVFGVDLCFIADVNFLFIFFSMRDLRVPSVDGFQIVAEWSVVGWILTIGSKNLGAPPQKKFQEPKTCKIGCNFGWLRTSTVHICRTYEDIKSDKCWISHDSSRICQKKSREFWSANFRGLEAKSYQSKLTFSGDHISALGGAALPHFYMR